MTKKKIIKYNNKSYTFYRDEDGHIHPEGEDYESVEYLIENREAVVEYIVKKMNYKLPKKEICCLCNREVKKENLKKYNKIVEKYGLDEISKFLKFFYVG
jgi:hypothetical protein